MRHLRLYRFESDDCGTYGVLVDENFEKVCVTGELPWRNNRPNRSCIPPGEYVADYMERSGSGRYKKVYWVRGVPGRSAILIHSGNVMGDVEKGYITHSNGCPLVGVKFGKLGGQNAVLASRIALGTLREEIGEQSFKLTVIDRTGG